MTTNYCRLTSRLSLRIAFALIAGALLNSSAAAQYLYNRMDAPTGQTPVALVAADFNGDHILDLAAVNRDDNTVSILLATPYGTFAPQVTYATGPTPVAVVAGDFNGDGKLDLAIADQNCAPTCTPGVGNGLVSILLGNGDGTFQPAVNYPAGSLPIGIVAADFNHDGKMDLAMANNPDNTVSILLGNGDGTFQVGTPAPLPGYPQTIAAGDFNGDGKTDLIVLSSVVSVLLSNGDGTFNRVDTALIVFPSVGIAVGDFNRDGKLDAVVGDTSPLGFYQPQVLLGRGDGTFEIQPSTALLTNVISADGIIAADFNHDGILDIAFSGHGVGAAASIALGIGDGTFQFPILSVPVTNGSPIVVGDFNGDGRLDVATVNEPGSVSISLGSGDGSFGHEADFAVESPGYFSTGPEVVADFNGDGKPDVAVRTTPGSVTGGAVMVVLGHGDGTLSSPISSPAGTAGLYAMAAGDFNHDGKMDVIIDNEGSVSVLLGNDDGSFQPPINTVVGATYTVQKIVTGDFNGDGKVDAAVIVYDSSIGRYELVNLTGSGTGAFTVGPPYVPPNNGWINSLVVADFNGDGKLDLALLDQNNSYVLVLLGRGDGSFQNPVSYPVAVTETLGVGDLNSDGKLDLVVASEFGMSVLLGKGDGTFQNQVYTAIPRITSYQLNSLAIADFNGDGKPDLATYSGGAFILLGNGDGTFRLPYMYHDTTYNGQFQGIVAAGDFNGDGTPDLVIAGEPPTAVPSVTLLLSAPMANLAPPGLTFAPEIIGTPSAPEAIALTNVGSAPLDLINTGLTSGDFSQTNTCSTLAPGANCAVNITFTPTEGGSRTGTLTLTDNASNTPQAVGLAGTGTGPSAGLSATGLSFGNQAEGTSSAAQAVTVTNNGTAPLTFSGITVTGEFAVATSGTTCSTSTPLAASGSCIINVTFAPAASGALSGNLMLTDNAGDSPQTVSLSGMGTGPGLSLSSPLSFSPQLVGTTSSAQTITLTSSGTANLTFSAAPTVSGPFAIAATGTTCSTANPVAGGGACTVAITFTPTAGGAATGSVSFSDNAPGSPQSVALSGTGEDFTFTTPTGSSTAASVTPGQTATFTLIVGGQGGMSGTVSFACTGAPSQATCTVSPNRLTVGSTGANVTVTVNTTAAGMGARPFTTPRPQSPGLRGLWMIALGMIAVGWLIGRRQPGLRRRSTLALLAFAVLLVAALAGCGGGSSTGPGPSHNPGTPGGTYPLTVTATTDSGTSAVSHSVTLTLTVN